MQITDSSKKADLLLILAWQETDSIHFAAPNRLAQLLKEIKHFRGTPGENFALSTPYLPEQIKEDAILLFGIENKPTSEQLYQKGAELISCLKGKPFSSISLAHLPEEFLIPFCRGALIASYQYSQKEKETSRVLQVNNPQILTREETIASAVHFARDLIHANADFLTPAQFALTAEQLSISHKNISFSCLTPEEGDLPLLQAVGKGASVPPRLIILQYTPSSAAPVALVGKGITFDSGGLNLKPTGSIERMKEDMGGAAAVLATIRAAAELELATPIVALIATAENAIGPNSYKPGDTYRSANGKTVEITNTDAEGRLVLADAITYAQRQFAPKQLIDIATLTGGMGIALGDEISGLFANDESLAKSLLAAADRSGDALWQMPLPVPYRKWLESPVADLRNSTNKRLASSITAALFLENFVDSGMPWAHLDIAGSVSRHETTAEHPTKVSGAGVRVLIDHLSHL